MTKSNILHPFINTAACAVLIIATILGCTKPEPTPGPTNPEDNDTKAPTITLVTSAVGVYGGKTVAVADGKLSIGETEVATWTDDKSEVSKCKTDLTFTASADGSKAKTITSGATLNKAGILKLTITDEAGNSAGKDITITEDNSAPEVRVLKDSIDVYGGKAVMAKDNTLSIGKDAVLQWNDDHGDECTITLDLNGAVVNLGDEVSKAGTLKFTVTDSKGLGTEANISLTENNSAPEVKVLKESVNVYGGKATTTKDNTLSIGKDAVLQWNDDHGDECTITLDLNGEVVNLGDEVSKAGTLKITISDSKGLSTEASITLTDQIVFGMESLDGLDLQIDKDVNLISGLSFCEGWSLAKVEIEKDGVRTEVTEPEHYTPAIAGNIVVIITLTDGSKTAEFKSGMLTVKPLTYSSVQPQKSEIFPDFNTANVQAYKRWGIYELAALAKSMKVRNGIKIIIFRDGEYIPNNGLHKWIGPDGSHGKEVYRNVNEGTGDSDNIWAIDEGWVEIESDIISLGLGEEPMIITCSHDIISAYNVQDLFENQNYCSLKRLGESENLLIFDAAGNVNSVINYKINEKVTNIAPYYNGRYWQTSAADPENNNIIPVTYGRFKNKAKFGVYQDQGHRASATAYISIDNSISPYGCVEYSNPNKINSNEEWSEGSTSYATPALAAMAKNAYDILHKWGVLNNMTELKKMLLKYATKIPATRQDIAADGTIIEDVDNGFVLVPDMLRLINEEIYPAIIGKASKTTDGTTLLHKDDGLNIAYTGAGTEYQTANGSWKSTDGITITEFFDKPQRFNPALLAKYGISCPAPVTIHLTDQSGLEIVSSAVTLP